MMTGDLGSDAEIGGDPAHAAPSPAKSVNANTGIGCAAAASAGSIAASSA